MNKYHLYQRTVKGKKSWYYWFYDEKGNQVRKSCKTQKKREAEAFIDQLMHEDVERDNSTKIRIIDIALAMFEPGSTYQKLQIARGKELSFATLKHKYQVVKNHIIPEFGERYPETIEAGEIENWLIGLKLKNSTKNRVMAVFDEILKECRRNNILKNVPYVTRFKPNTQKKDIFTNEELDKLLPRNFTYLEIVWRCTSFYTGLDCKTHNYGNVYGMLFLLMAATGMRSGEIRAITPDQITENGIIINKSLDDNNEIQYKLKMGKESYDPRFRVVLVPSKIKEMLNEYMNIRPKNPEGNFDFIFSINGEQIKANTLWEKLETVLVRMGIKKDRDDKERKLTVHSFRYTYNTMMVNSNRIPEEVLRKMIGHTNREMTEYYTRPDLEMQLKGLQMFQNELDKIF